MADGVGAASGGHIVRHITDETTDTTTGETTSHPTKQPEDGCQVVGYSHLTSPASEKLLAGHPKDAGQVIDETTSHLTKAASCQVIGYGYSHSTDGATSHSANPPKDGG
jgi:hypothetical protein